MKTTLVLLLTSIIAGLAQVPPPACTNCPPPGTNGNYSPYPATNLVKYGTHVRIDWRTLDTNESDPPPYSVVLTNNMPEWSTNMIGSQSPWANDVTILRYRTWIFVLWWDPNSTNGDVELTFNTPDDPIWFQIPTNQSNPRSPRYVMIRIANDFGDIQPQMFFRYRRQDLGLE
jgi:hypothetical protein